MVPLRQRNDPYRLEAILDTDGLGTVLKAYDARLERSVAIKVLRHDRLKKPGVAERFLREARDVAAVSHPNLVEIYDVVDWEEDYGLVMELVEGTTLAQRLEDGPLEVEQAVRLLAEVVEGLSAIHERGIVHRDLKPANIMLTPQGHVKIMDFDLMQFEGNEGSGVLFGTPAYMAPERARGLPATARSDLFSLGVLAYETLTGARPFGGSIVEVFRKLNTERQTPVREVRSDVPARLSDLVDHLLEKDPENRPGSAREVAAELTAAFQLERTSAMPGASRSVETVTLENTEGPGRADLGRWLRFAYYRLLPRAAYRRHADLVDKSFQRSLRAEEERELAELEGLLDRLEEPQWRATRRGLIRLRDELKARRAGD